MITKPAGFWKRLLAGLLDSLIISLPLSMISFGITGEWGGNMATTLLDTLYYIIVPVIWAGYTVGKRITGIHIVKVNGEKIGFGTMLMRVIIAAIVYLITFGIGLIVSIFMVALREDKRSIHDFIAGTYVMDEKA